MQLLSAQPDFIITDEDGILIGSSGGTSLLTGGTEGQAPIVQGDGSVAWGAAGASSLSELDEWDGTYLTVPPLIVNKSGQLKTITIDSGAQRISAGSGAQFILGSTSLPTYLDGNTVTARDTFIVQQQGGVAGTDEIQIYHDGSNAYIDSQSGLIRINSTSNTELQINGSTNWTFKYNSLQASNSATRDYAILRAGGAGDLILGADQGDLILQPDGSAQGDIYLKQDTHLEGTLKVLQPGGVAGTDEVQIYHDGTDAYIVPQSGDLHFSTGASGPRVTLAGEFSNNQGVTDGEIFGEDAVVNGSYGVGVGHAVTAGERCVVAGWNARGTSRDVVLGHNTIATSATGRNVLVGHNVNVSGASYACTFLGYECGGASVNSAIAIGYGSQVTANSQFVAGSDFAPTTDVYFGRGVVHATPVDATVHGTGGSGTDVAGASLYLAGGKGTGSGAGGSLIFQTAAAGASGSTLNTLTTHVEINSDGLIILPTIPTSDPSVSGALWSDGGTLKVS